MVGAGVVEECVEGVGALVCCCSWRRRRGRGVGEGAEGAGDGYEGFM